MLWWDRWFFSWSWEYKHWSIDWVCAPCGCFCFEFGPILFEWLDDECCKLFSKTENESTK